MIVLNVRNVNEGLSMALSQLMVLGKERPSRNGPVLAFPQPVATTYSVPTERVLFSARRNANPVFHLLESFWMLAGRRDVKFPATIVKNMKSFTDDGKNFHGAYGHRWRNHFGYDQLIEIIAELKRNPESRRIVLGMWDPGGFDVSPDLIQGINGGLDIPCNTHIYFDRRDGNLNMTVCCRSNDIVWGCYGANAVHMSVLQEYMAAAIGCPVGWYTQMSNDLHLYTDKFPIDTIYGLSRDVALHDFYKRVVRPTPLLAEGEQIEMLAGDIEEFFFAFDGPGGIQATVEGCAYRTMLFRETVVPMVRAWLFRKTPDRALQEVESIRGEDWRIAMRDWVKNNHQKKVTA